MGCVLLLKSYQWENEYEEGLMNENDICRRIQENYTFSCWGFEFGFWSFEFGFTFFVIADLMDLLLYDLWGFKSDTFSRWEVLDMVFILFLSCVDISWLNGKRT